MSRWNIVRIWMLLSITIVVALMINAILPVHIVATSYVVNRGAGSR